MKKRKKKGSFSTIILIFVFLAGLSLLLYPTISDYWNSLHQSHAIADYTKQVAQLDKEDRDEMWEDACRYNQTLLQKKDRYKMSDKEREEYESLLNISGNGILGYIDIPLIRCKLPIYHGTDEASLQIAVGHIEGTSLPTGGPGTHCVLSGHRGLPSAKLFTNLDKLTEGDFFILQILDRTLTYEVDQILIVEPDNLEPLEIEKNKDYCTLVTCTPYGVNSHRLLVRGHRVANREEAHVAADAIQIRPLIVAPFVAIPMLILLLIVLLIRTRRKKKYKNRTKISLL